MRTNNYVKIVHIGNNRVRGRILPGTVETGLKSVFGAVSYTDMRVNGTTCLIFTHPQRIEAIDRFLLTPLPGSYESIIKAYNNYVVL